MKLSELEVKSDSIFYRLEQGDNKVRIVSEFVTRQVTFDPAKGAVTRYCVWVIDRREGEVKFAEFGPSIIKQLQNLQNDVQYEFDVTPSYDINIKREGTGLETKYNVLADRKDTPLTEEENKMISEFDKPSVFLAKLDAAKADGAEKKEEIKVEDLPF